jgi:hypothetical protein
MGWYGLDCSGSGYGQVESSCECGNDPSTPVYTTVGILNSADLRIVIWKSEIFFIHLTLHLWTHFNCSLIPSTSERANCYCLLTDRLTPRNPLFLYQGHVLYWMLINIATGLPSLYMWSAAKFEDS